MREYHKNIIIMMNTNLGMRTRYANRRRRSTFVTTKRVVWKTRSKHVA